MTLPINVHQVRDVFFLKDDVLTTTTALVYVDKKYLPEIIQSYLQSQTVADNDVFSQAVVSMGATANHESSAVIILKR